MQTKRKQQGRLLVACGQREQQCGGGVDGDRVVGYRRGRHVEVGGSATWRQKRVTRVKEESGAWVPACAADVLNVSDLRMIILLQFIDHHIHLIITVHPHPRPVSLHQLVSTN